MNLRFKDNPAQSIPLMAGVYICNPADSSFTPVICNGAPLYFHFPVCHTGTGEQPGEAVFMGDAAEIEAKRLVAMMLFKAVHDRLSEIHLTPDYDSDIEGLVLRIYYRLNKNHALRYNHYAV